MSIQDLGAIDEFVLAEEESSIVRNELVIWTIAIVIFFALWPFLKKHRAYFVIVGALFFTPGIVHYKGLGFVKMWPLIACLPAYFMKLDEGGIHLLLYYALFPASVTGAILWGLSYWLIPRKKVA